MKTWYTYKGLLKLLLITAVLSFCVNFSFAQFAPSLPQRTLTVLNTQAINFGTFCLTGSVGGTITVGWNNIVSTTGGVLHLAIGQGTQPAIFAIKLCQGRNVRITFAATTPLTGTGPELTLHLGPTELGGNNALFTTNRDCDFITLLRVGGTLDVPDSALPGTYSGNLEIILNQE